MKIITTSFFLAAFALLAGCVSQYPYYGGANGAEPWWVNYDINDPSMHQMTTLDDGRQYYNYQTPRQYTITQEDEQKYQNVSSSVQKRMQEIARKKAQQGTNSEPYNHSSNGAAD